MDYLHHEMRLLLNSVKHSASSAFKGHSAAVKIACPRPMTFPAFVRLLLNRPNAESGFRQHVAPFFECEGSLPGGTAVIAIHALTIGPQHLASSPRAPTPLGIRFRLPTARRLDAGDGGVSAASSTGSISLPHGRSRYFRQILYRCGRWEWSAMASEHSSLAGRGSARGGRDAMVAHSTIHFCKWCCAEHHHEQSPAVTACPAGYRRHRRRFKVEHAGEVAESQQNAEGTSCRE